MIDPDGDIYITESDPDEIDLELDPEAAEELRRIEEEEELR